MTDFKKLYLDTAPLIYFLEEESLENIKMRQIFLSLSEQIEQVVLSTITCMEYLVKPYRMKDQKAIQSFWAFVEEGEVDVRPVDMRIALKAAEIRAEYKFKAMDSLQLATACVNGCDLFLTNDKQLKQFKEISCVTVEEWKF